MNLDNISIGSTSLRDVLASIEAADKGEQISCPRCGEGIIIKILDNVYFCSKRCGWSAHYLKNMMEGECD